MRVTIEVGNMEDYRALAHWHYRGGSPRGVVRVLRARCHDEIIGVLVVAMPVLNASWRGGAWPGWLDGLDLRARAARINRELRVIARVIVDPRFRGAGIARRLVSAYLASPMTPKTETVAAMGAMCPFFERAGMRRVPAPRRREARRVLDYLKSRGVEAWMLADAGVRDRVARDVAAVRRVRAWARSGRGTSKFARLGARRLMDKAWVGLSGELVAFVHEAKGGFHGQACDKEEAEDGRGLCRGTRAAGGPEGTGRVAVAGG